MSHIHAVHSLVYMFLSFCRQPRRSLLDRQQLFIPQSLERSLMVTTVCMFRPSTGALGVYYSLMGVYASCSSVCHSTSSSFLLPFSTPLPCGDTDFSGYRIDRNIVQPLIQFSSCGCAYSYIYWTSPRDDHASRAGIRASWPWNSCLPSLRRYH